MNTFGALCKIELQLSHAEKQESQYGALLSSWERILVAKCAFDSLIE